ncbi:MAG: acetyl-CoA carboxylase biotin carboxylase subunit [Granulosicoccaceae bacterium]
MTKLFDKILIANRGEIACRIIRTCQQLGIATVAVYSDADAEALHVQMADEAVNIGPAASAESYLRIDKIIDAIKQTGAQAVHPGFGFLSENAAFADALRDAGVVFIGPGNHAISVMGDKIESKKLAESAGVNVIPGHTAALVDADEALKISAEIGCPVMLKASAGGGGKGMRVAWTIDDVIDSFNSAQAEARTAFGDDRVFVEKFIERPRHIEIQVLADSHGNTLYLQERECSIQRRHQKVIEEAPSPFIDPATRKAMGEQAVALAKAVDYQSAGTVELIVDKDRNFYFLEMNTRLQVEHPVTEMITGLDLVEQMIRVAAGEKLAFQQEDIQLNGWSMECRVYAEDPDRNFMPSTGRLTRYEPPRASEAVRVDTGVFEGGEISMFYDPMIAKLVSHGETREQAAAAMQSALDAYVIRGVQHNIPFLAALMRHPSFQSGDLTTGFIDEHFPEGFDSKAEPIADSVLMACVAAACQAISDDNNLTIDGQLSAPSFPELTRYQIIGLEEKDVPVGVSMAANGWQVNVDGEIHAINTNWRPGQLLFNAELDGQEHAVQVDRDGMNWRLTHRGRVVALKVLSPRMAELQKLMPEKVAPDMSRFLLSPMPGLLMRLSVTAGEQVKAGQELAVIEAMKMENVLLAERDAVVKEVRCEAGQSLEVDQIIVEFEETD